MQRSSSLVGEQQRAKHSPANADHQQAAGLESERCPIFLPKHYITMEDPRALQARQRTQDEKGVLTTEKSRTGPRIRIGPRNWDSSSIIRQNRHEPYKPATDADLAVDSEKAHRVDERSEPTSTKEPAPRIEGEHSEATQAPTLQKPAQQTTGTQTENTEVVIDDATHATEGEPGVVNADSETSHVEVKVLLSPSVKVTTTVYKAGKKVKEIVVE